MRRKVGMPQIQAIDLFCGAGGLTKGLSLAGIDVKVGVDTDKECRYPYTLNNSAKFINKSVVDVGADELLKYVDKNTPLLIAGCAPCQTFSRYNQKATTEDSRWWLIGEFLRIVKDISPEYVTMENVPGLEGKKVFSDFIEGLEEEGYNVNYQVVDCSEYGLPQVRKRLVLLGAKNKNISIISPCGFSKVRHKTVREAIGMLPRINAGETFFSDELHHSASLTDINLKRIRASKPGGTWRDWPDELVSNCHKSVSGKTYVSVYGRMRGDLPSPTITTQFYGFGNGRFGHYEQDRALSLREGAILQGFPKSYKFVEPGSKLSRKTVGRLIGNAVPVRLGKVIGKSFINGLEG